MPAKMGGTLPSGDHNGLDAIITQLINNPNTKRVALITFDVDYVKHDTTNGEKTPHLRILRVEVPIKGDLATIETITRRAIEARSGETVLPLEMEDELQELFRGLIAEDGTVVGEVPDVPSSPPPSEPTDDGDMPDDPDFG